jgi:hypothetical protein
MTTWSRSCQHPTRRLHRCHKDTIKLDPLTPLFHLGKGRGVGNSYSVLNQNVGVHEWVLKINSGHYRRRYRRDAENIRKLLQFENDVGRWVGRTAEGIEVAGETKPDVVLMDINMPDMDGIAPSDPAQSLCPNRDPLGPGRSELYAPRCWLARIFSPSPDSDELTLLSIARDGPR